MQGVTLAFFEDVWSRNFLNIFAAPVSMWEYVCGLVISSIATSSVGLVVMLVLASAVFGLSFFAYGIVLIPFLLILFLFGIALGILASAMVLRLGPASEWFVWPIPALDFAVRRSFLSAFNASAMDAISVASIATGLRVRGDARSHLGGPGFANGPALGRRSCPALYSGRLPSSLCAPIVTPCAQESSRASALKL